MAKYADDVMKQLSGEQKVEDGKLSVALDPALRRILEQCQQRVKVKKHGKERTKKESLGEVATRLIYAAVELSETRNQEHSGTAQRQSN